LESFKEAIRLKEAFKVGDKISIRRFLGDDMKGFKEKLVKKKQFGKYIVYDTKEQEVVFGSAAEYEVDDYIKSNKESLSERLDRLKEGSNDLFAIMKSFPRGIDMSDLLDELKMKTGHVNDWNFNETIILNKENFDHKKKIMVKFIGFAGSEVFSDDVAAYFGIKFPNIHKWK
jgi:hypothetical protein